MDISRRGFLKGTATLPIVGLLRRYKTGEVEPIVQDINKEPIIQDVIEEPIIQETRYLLRHQVLDFPAIQCGDTYTSMLEISNCSFESPCGSVVQIGPRTIQFRSPEWAPNNWRKAPLGGKLHLTLRAPTT